MVSDFDRAMHRNAPLGACLRRPEDHTSLLLDSALQNPSTVKKHPRCFDFPRSPRTAIEVGALSTYIVEGAAREADVATIVAQQDLGSRGSGIPASYFLLTTGIARARGRGRVKGTSTLRWDDVSGSSAGARNARGTRRPSGQQWWFDETSCAFCTIQSTHQGAYVAALALPRPERDCDTLISQRTFGGALDCLKRPRGILIRPSHRATP